MPPLLVPVLLPVLLAAPVLVPPVEEPVVPGPEEVPPLLVPALLPVVPAAAVPVGPLVEEPLPDELVTARGGGLVVPQATNASSEQPMASDFMDGLRKGIQSVLAGASSTSARQKSAPTLLLSAAKGNKSKV